MQRSRGKGFGATPLFLAFCLVPFSRLLFSRWVGGNSKLKTENSELLFDIASQVIPTIELSLNHRVDSGNHAD